MVRQSQIDTTIDSLKEKRQKEEVPFSEIYTGIPKEVRENEKSQMRKEVEEFLEGVPRFRGTRWVGVGGMGLKNSKRPLSAPNSLH